MLSCVRNFGQLKQLSSLHVNVNSLKPKLILIIKIQSHSGLTLFKEIISVYSENHTKPLNILYGQNAELSTLKAGGTYTYHYALTLK
jgi:hypothetical protein